MSQTPADWWYFGNNAGMHFDNQGNPSVDLNGQISTLEGCATIADNNGNLLFYTDGSLVYDQTHTQMPNGSGLLGWSSSTHSAIIVPKPGNPDLYYIFTVDATENGGVNGFRYTMVDMTLNGGFGDVVTDSLNIVLFDTTSEKVAAFPHANGQDFWVVAHPVNTDEYHSYLVTSNGVNQNPVISQIGTNLIYSFSNSSIVRGYLRFHPSGDYIASAVLSDSIIEYMDFDRATGVLSNYRELTVPTWSYGIEFSPNGNLMYVSGWGSGGDSIYQFDVSSGVEATMQNSMFSIARTSFFTAGALQLGLDGKIYFGQVGSQYLGVVNDPDVYGLGCNYADTGFYLGGALSRYGLPTFVQSFLLPQFDVVSVCIGDSTQFFLDSSRVDSVLIWNFGDPASGSANTSTKFNPKHMFTDTGNYEVFVIVQVDSIIDTVFSNVYIYPRQSVDLGPDLLLCDPDTVILDATSEFASYVWHDSSTAATFEVTSDVVAHVTLFGFCDTASDTVVIRYDEVVPLDLGPDTAFCAGLSYVIDANVQVDAEYGWNTGDSVDVISVNRSGTYIFVAENGCGIFTDSVEVEVIPIPDSLDLLPPDTVNCFDNEIVLERPINDSIIFVWSDSTEVERYEVDTTDVVWLAAFNDCGFIVDTMNIIFNGEILTELGEDTVICDEDSIKLFGVDSLASYVWNTGDTTDTVVTVPEVSQNYIVTITLRQCNRVEQKFVESNALACPPIDCELQSTNVFTPNGDGINDLFRISSDCKIFSYDLYIYNRWGQLVHSSRNKNFGWDGYVNGELASEGVYFFTVEYRDQVVVDADRRLTQGSFTLLRE